jgi:transposase
MEVRDARSYWDKQEAISDGVDERGHPRRSKLVIMERDPDAKKRGYSAKSYMEALTKGLLPHYRRSQLFMQDNAGIHRSRAVANFFRDHHITSIIWPAYSPDLNPIEHLWWVLKRRMFKLYPQYNNYSKAQEEWDGFCEALKEQRWQASSPGLLPTILQLLHPTLDSSRKIISSGSALCPFRRMCPPPARSAATVPNDEELTTRMFDLSRARRNSGARLH